MSHGSSHPVLVSSLTSSSSPVLPPPHQKNINLPTYTPNSSLPSPVPFGGSSAGARYRSSVYDMDSGGNFGMNKNGNPAWCCNGTSMGTLMSPFEVGRRSLSLMLVEGRRKHHHQGPSELHVSPGVAFVSSHGIPSLCRLPQL